MANNLQKYNLSFLWMICLVAAMGGFLFGYDWVVIGGAKPFYEPYFELTTPNMKGWGTSSALIGCIFGALLCFSLSDKYGRRRLLILSGALFTISAIGTALSTDFTWFNIYRIVGGFGIGIALNLSPMYIAEMSPPHMRGKLVSVNQLMVMFGILAAQIANWRISLLDTQMPVDATEEIIRQSWNGQMGWRWMFGVETIPALSFFLLMFFMPESVRWLVKNGQNKKAVDILSKVGGTSYAHEEVTMIRNTISNEEVSKVHFGELLKPGLFKILLLGIFLALLQQWCGMNVIFYYAADIFLAAGYNIKQLMLQIVVIGTIMVLSVFVTIFVVDKVGRKFLMLFGTGSLAIIYIIEGYLFHLGVQGIPIVILTLCSVGFYSLTLAPVVWVILSEIFPNRIRGAAMSLAAVSLWIGNFSLTFSFPAIKENLGWTFNFWLYAIICIIGFIVILYKLPETKGKSLEEIEDAMADRKSGKIFIPNKKRIIMKEKVITVLLLFFLSSCVIGQVSQEEKVPLAPKLNRKPEKVQPFSSKYSLEELKNNFSDEMMRLAAKQNEKVKETNIKGKWKPTPESIDSHTAPEWFKDVKFGMFIDWGLWSVAGWAPKREKGAMYPDWYEFRCDTDTAFFKYHKKNWGNDFKRDDFIQLFTAKNYQPEKLVDIAKDAGMKYIVPFSKHHGGFCLWPSSYTQRDAGDMGPKKDLINSLVESCQKEGLKFGFYFSIEEWEYPLIGSNGELLNRGWGWRGGIKPYTADLEKKISGKIAVKDYASDYLVPQATEFIDKYDPDLIWYDGDMSSISAEGLHTYDIAAYLYNKAEGRKEVAVNDRYGTKDKKWLRSVRGDFFTNEYGDMEKEAKQTDRAWEACWGISQSFGYNWQDTDENVISSKEFIDKFVDIVAHGGNLLLIVNLDGQGALPKIQENRLRDIGKWLKVNGEGIYSTRPFTRQSDGTVSYTRSKDNQYVYAIMREWPGQELQLKGINAEKGSNIEMLGHNKPLEWINGGDGISVKFPAKLQDISKRPCDHAWILKIKLGVNAATSQSPIQFVEPLIGTAPADTESAVKHSEAGMEIKGQTFPAVGRPFGMTQWTPETRTTETKCISPYYYNDKLITGFRGSHWMNGSCTQDYGSVTLMPFSTNRIDTLKNFPPVSGYSHKNETATPAYYRVLLESFNIQAELSATVRSGMLRFVYSGEEINYLQIRANSDEKEGRIWFEKDRNEIIGYNPVHRIYQGIGQSAGFSGYFVIRFDQPFKVMPQTSYPQQMVVGFENGKTILVKIGTSFTSIEAARNNLDQEITNWDFESIRKASEAEWNQMLGRVEVEGDSDQDKIKFYTALYHCLQLPRTSSDIDGSYQGFAQDTSIHKAEDFVYYDDFSMWDTYRALHPLLTLLEPKRSLDMVKSLVAKAGQGGWMPIFPAWGNYTAAMIGDHVSTMISDAYAKGIRDFDTETAWKYMRKNAFEHPSKEEYLDGKGRRALTSYLKYGYIPLEDPVLEAFHVNEQVSRTLEYAFDDFALAQFAKGLGKKDDYTALMKRSQNYRNVFDTQTNYVRGRHADGRWIEQFDPFARASFICEGTPFQYTWYVPHDVPGLIKLMGGREAFLKHLNTFFDDGHYWHGNETDQQAPYLFAMAGDLRKTQEWVRRIADEEYGTSPGGLSGNEDAGQMSAWLVCTMMGFYPVCPATDQYVMGVPMFKKITVNLENGKKFILNAPENSAEKPYIKSVRWNGKTCRDNWASLLEMMKGGVIDYKMTGK